MADRDAQKDGYGAADVAAAVNTTNAAEPLDVTGEEKGHLEISTPGEPSSHAGSEKGSPINEKHSNLEAYATNTSSVTRTDPHVDEPVKKKPWYKKMNPLKWGKLPPVPENRKVSREKNASFLSKLSFQWVAPIMSVSLPNT